MQNKFHFFITFLIGVGLLFLGLFAFIYSSYFVYAIVVVLGLLILLNAVYAFVQFIKGKKRSFVQLLIHIGFGLLFVLLPQLPMSLVVIAFSLYICMTGISQFITYFYYRRERVSGRVVFLVSSIVLLFVALTFLFSPSIHAKDMTKICALYMTYLGFKFIGRSVRELLSEDRKDSLKRRVHVSLPVIMVAWMPRMVLEYVNEHLETKDDFYRKNSETSPLDVLVHVSKDGFGAIGHVDICYEGKVIAYGAYDESSHRLMGAMGDGVLFQADKDDYISFRLNDDLTSGVFEYNIYLDSIQKQRVYETIEEFKKGLVTWSPPCMKDITAEDYASRLYKATHASFYKFIKGQFKYYFVMTTNCVLLADRIIGKSGIDIVNLNGIITPGTYYNYLEEESRKENSRVLKKRIHYNGEKDQ